MRIAYADPPYPGCAHLYRGHPDYAGEVDHVKHYIWALRQKIEADPGHPQHILTERGFGYRFE